MSNELQVIRSGDGSHTLFNPDLNETYHSTHGAINESAHVFIKEGLEYITTLHDSHPIKILEVGFGTGLNVLLTIKKAIELDLEVEITSLEKYPLDNSIVNQLNYTDLLDWDLAQDFFEQIHSCLWEESYQITPKIKLIKIKKGLEEFTDKGYDLVYYDAFAPSKQPELWELDILKHVATLCTPNAVFTTYCAKGQVRRNLEQANFEIERLKGPPGKREMLRGTLKMET